MKNEVLQKGQVVYIINYDPLKPTLGEIEECVSHGLFDNHYRIKGYDGHEYFRTYPTLVRDHYFILTRLEYKEFLEERKKENDKIIDKYTRDNEEIEIQFRNYESCQNEEHEYGEWEELTDYEGNDIYGTISYIENPEDTNNKTYGCSYTVGRPYSYWVRRCKCCGLFEKTLDKTIVESSRVRGK